MRKAAALLTFCVLAGCGARTELGVGSVARDESPTGDAGSLSPDASACANPGSPWLLFDLFNDPAGTIWAMRADGSGAHALALPSTPALFPSVSRDGAHLLYVSRFVPADAGDVGTLFLYDLASRTATEIATGYALLDSALSPDGQTIAYTANLDVRVVGVDGTGDRLLLQGPSPEGLGIGGYGTPFFLDDSRTIIYGTSGTVGRVELDGSGQEDLISEEDYIVLFPNAALSPDGLSLAAFTACDPSANEGTLRIYPYASLPAGCATGTAVTTARQANTFNESNSPTWSATGVIAFVQDSDVYVVDADGGAVTNLTSALTADGGTASDPAWAPPCTEVP